MRKLFFLLLFILAAVGASARQDTLKYRISLKDKAATTYSLEHPEQFRFCIMMETGYISRQSPLNIWLPK